MQNQSGKFSRFVRKNGYYMALALAILAVGAGALVFFRTAAQTPARDELDTEVSVSIPVQPDPEPAAPDAAEDPEPSPAPLPDAETVAPTEPVQLTIVRPVSGEVVQHHSVDRLCYNTTMRDWRTHDGTDIACAVGTEVRAAMEGAVSAVYDDDFLGTVVEITHATGHVTRYANLTAMPTVKVGDSVRAGQVIGAVGATALGEAAQTAHLHFSVEKNGAAIDPEAFLS